jgi:hypothetical protein
MGFFQTWLYPPNLLSSSLPRDPKERPFPPPRQGQTPEFTKGSSMNRAARRPRGSCVQFGFASRSVFDFPKAQGA